MVFDHQTPGLNEVQSLPRSNLQPGQDPGPSTIPHPQGIQAWEQSGCGGLDHWKFQVGKAHPPNVYGVVGLLALLHPHGDAVQCMRHLKNQRESLRLCPATSPEVNNKCQPAEMPLRDVAKALDKIHHSFGKTTALEQAV